MLFTEKESILIKDLLDKYMSISENKKVGIDCITKEFSKEDIHEIRHKIVSQIEALKKEDLHLDDFLENYNKTAIIIYQDIFEKLAFLDK